MANFKKRLGYTKTESLNLIFGFENSLGVLFWGMPAVKVWNFMCWNCFFPVRSNVCLYMYVYCITKCVHEIIVEELWYPKHWNFTNRTRTKDYTPLKMHSTHLLLVFVATPTIAFGSPFNHPPLFCRSLLSVAIIMLHFVIAHTVWCSLRIAMHHEQIPNSISSGNDYGGNDGGGDDGDGCNTISNSNINIIQSMKI